MSGDEKELDGLVSTVLLGGVLLSVALIVAGAVWEFLKTGQLVPAYKLGGSNLLVFLGSDVGNSFAGHFRPRLLVNLGIAALMLTPWVRVLISVLFFGLAQKNWKYTAFTAFVLTVLTWSLAMR